MDTSQLISKSLRYPSSSFTKVLILGILTILSSLIIPVFLVLGYLFKVMKSSLEGSSELPDFNGWTSLFTDGLKVFAVLSIYSFVPWILILLGTWGAIQPMLTVPGAGSLFNLYSSMGLVGGVALFGFGLMLVVSFFIPISLANMVYQNKFSAAFKFSEITGKIGEIGWFDYLIWYVIMVIIFVVVFYVSSFLIFPIIIGVIMVPLIILPYLFIFSARSVALIYSYESSSHEYYRHSRQIK